MNDLATIDNNGLAVSHADLATALAEEMGFGSQLGGSGFDRVKVPSGGGLMWELPGANPDDPEVVKELRGVVVDDHFISSLWLGDDGKAAAFTGGNSHPDAIWFEVRPNEIVGVLNDRARAAGCQENIDADPFNQWGSGANGNGKAAKQSYRLYLQRQDDIAPLQITLPPASVGNWLKFKRHIMATHKCFIPAAVVSLTLKKADSAGGVSYSQVQFNLAEKLGDEAAHANLLQREALRSVTRVVPKLDDGSASDVAPSAVADAIAETFDATPL